jgi:lysozyme family protein
MVETYLKYALPEVLTFEGSEFTNNPNDSGGPTRYGIIQREYNAHRKANGLPIQSVNLISQAEVNNIYKGEYWNPIQGDLLAFPIDWITFDAAVNMGVQTSVNMLEQALNLPEDYKVDPKVIEAVKTACITMDSTHLLKEKELSERIARYHAIVVDHAHDVEFLHGWLSRVEELGDYSPA